MEDTLAGADWGTWVEHSGAVFGARDRARAVVELAASGLRLPPPSRCLSCTPVVIGQAEAIRRAHGVVRAQQRMGPAGFRHLAEWVSDGVCRCPDECLVGPAEYCPHGLASWWFVLRTLDRPDGAAPLPPIRLVPHPDRLDPRRAGE